MHGGLVHVQPLVAQIDSEPTQERKQEWSVMVEFALELLKLENNVDQSRVPLMDFG